MAELTIRLKRTADGQVVLTIVRPDGTTTWNRLHPGLQVHDLFHYAAEKTLGIRDGFFGLIAQGWDITAFAEPGAPAQLPRLAVWVEHLVGLLQQEKVNGTPFSAAQLNRSLREIEAREGTSIGRDLTEEELAAIRALLADLLRRWWEVPNGGTLELRFDAT